MMDTQKWLAGVIVIVAMIGGLAYSYGQEQQERTRQMTVCVASGGDFSLTWNWKPTCEIHHSNR